MFRLYKKKQNNEKTNPILPINNHRYRANKKTFANKAEIPKVS